MDEKLENEMSRTIWVCKNTTRGAYSMEVMIVPPNGINSCCDDDGMCEVCGGYCDAKQFRVVEVKGEFE